MLKKLTLTLVVLFATFSVFAQKRDIKTETQTKRYYVEDGKKKYISNSKTQKMWDEILQRCPACLAEAQKYNVNIWQNDLYKKKTTRVNIKPKPYWPTSIRKENNEELVKN